MQLIVQGYPAYAYTGGRAYDPGKPGPAIVFVHGAAFDHSVWQWQSRYFAHHGFGVLALDLPGHGRSPGPARTSIAGMSDWLADFIAAACLDKAMLVGHSMGSLVTLETALSHPGRVSKLALVGTSVPMPVGEPFLAAAADDSPAAFDMETVWGHARGSPLATSPVPGTALMGAARALNGRAHPGVLHADLAACRDYQPGIEALARLAVPTLVVGGRRDQMTPWRDAKAVADRIAGARFELLDAGHSMMGEAPRELLRVLRQFLAWNSRGLTP